jgi:hypothetical protein
MADIDRFDDDSLEDPVPKLRPQRPAAIEFAAAILIVSGVLGLVGAMGAASGLPAGMEQLLVITAAMNVGSVAIGILVRFGRAWIVAVNYVAVLGFLDLLGAGGSGLALMLGVADIVVIVLLFVHKPWFDAVRRDAQRRAAERRIAGPPVGGG